MPTNFGNSCTYIPLPQTKKKHRNKHTYREVVYSSFNHLGGRGVIPLFFLRHIASHREAAAPEMAVNDLASFQTSTNCSSRPFPTPHHCSQTQTNLIECCDSTTVRPENINHNCLHYNIFYVNSHALLQTKTVVAVLRLCYFCGFIVKVFCPGILVTLFSKFPLLDFPVPKRNTLATSVGTLLWRRLLKLSHIKTQLPSCK